MVDIRKRERARFRIILEDRLGKPGMKMRMINFNDGKEMNNVDNLHRYVEEHIKKL